ncbi:MULTISPECIES: DUF2971 domain-containing protein [Enterobacteriaceae]|uniref:DUF2971 domain-containing protein n=1 Tax=Enterobacteriaceae TaxID=543 RepID=UPI0009833E9D|nr:MULTISPECIES: DUF2971 domain-containing protein [Enterobacteriaceae]MBC5380252.1 DUF2971 domain-containing protein [Klebsiella variicola]HDG1099563.1 DUF2971 domain-containing protein [Klebsiella aerogenes]HDG1101054.1 DUF2971 domain-containing protein [Klebsiella aerogenes]HDR1956690.1 DUF2971 domain-containing protein [Enterobacter hormaechei]
MLKGSSKSNDTMRVYYLTNAEYAISNIALKRIKVSRYQDLNDPFELLAADLSDKNVRKELRKIKRKIEDEQGIICFSTTWDNPLLWGHYADKHRGIALGFDIPKSMLQKVEYEKDLSKVTLEKCSDEIYIKKLSLTKFEHWKYENEYRLHIDLKLESEDSGLYFKYFSNDLKLREVILGVKCTVPISSMCKFFEEKNEKVEVIKSRIAYKDFKIVKNKLATRNK